MSAANLAQRAVGWISRKMRERVPYDPSNLYLEGPFAPVAQELTDTQLVVDGQLPPQLNGLYLRIGPNPIKVDNPATYHWFVGDGMVHGLRLQAGQALWYRNRWVGSDKICDARQQPRTPGPRRGISDVVNTNVFGHAGSIWAATEAGVYPVELTPELETIRYGYFNATASLPFTAHPHADPDTGELHAICYDATNPRAVQYVVIDQAGALAHKTSIPVQHGPMIHDCAITKSKVVVLDLPVTLSWKALFSGATFPYRWNPKHQARVGVMPKRGQGTEVQWWQVEACAVFHSCNAYDLDDGGLVMDVVVHSRMFATSTIGPEIGISGVTFERWTMRPGNPKVERKVWSRQMQEFPRCDERLIGRPYRYAYTVGFGADTTQSYPLIRHDLQTGLVDFHDFGAQSIPGEFVFVPRPGGQAEDDGWLVGFVYRSAHDTSDFVVIDAQRITAPPVAVVHLPGRVPMGFHGNWVPMD